MKYTVLYSEAESLNRRKKKMIEKIETTLQKRNILSDEGMVYEGTNVNSLPSRGKEHLKKIIKEHAILFEDDTYFYVVMNDAEFLNLQGRNLTGLQKEFAIDFSVDKLKKAHYGFLSELVVEVIE